MDTLLKQFDSFLKRSMFPSSVLILILLLFSYDKIDIYKNKVSTLVETNYFFIILFMMIILLIALSFLMSILTQIFFDNMMKRNFNSYLLYQHENYILDTLRDKSINKLKQENNEFNDIELTDFFLYQILGRKLQFLKYKTNTKRYVDETKSAGSIFIAFIIALIIQIVINFSIYNLFFGFVLIIFTYFLAREYIKSKYRSRAIRIYTNYLIGDNNPV